jgi:hypothetical protein
MGLEALARQLHPEAKSHILFFVFFRQECFEGAFFLPSFFGTRAATISYDCRIKSRNSFHRTASNRSSITHL